MGKEEPISTLTELLNTPDNTAGPYEIIVDGETILLDLDALRIIQKQLKNAQNKALLQKELGGVIKMMKK